MIKILFVCHGNICRSPMGEFIMKDMIRKRGLEKKFYIKSAALTNEAIGNPIDYRAKRILLDHNIPIKNRRARRIEEKDLLFFDYILYMDQSNERIIHYLFPTAKENKFYSLLSFTDQPRDILDPWYTGNFEKAYQDIKEGVLAFLKHLGY